MSKNNGNDQCQNTETKKTDKDNKNRRYIVMDIVFYGGSLNYDQGTGNYQELKKITKWDGKKYVMVSRYALRYSILHWANKLFPNEWKLAGTDVLTQNNKVAALNADKINVGTFNDYPEFDLFGFMMTKKSQKKRGRKKENEESKDQSEEGNAKGESITRTSPVKISHAFSLTPYNYDSHFTANLDVMKRAGGEGSNPVVIEEKRDFYIYNVVIDVDRIGKYNKEEHGKNDIGDIDISNKRSERIEHLVKTLLNLKREIKGRIEDLSPWLVICGLYKDGKYETYLDRIELAKSSVYKVITKEKEGKDHEGRKIIEIENETVEKNAPKFVIDIEKKCKKVTLNGIEEEIKKFLDGERDDNEPNILVYKRKFLETEPSFELDTKERS